MHMTWTRHHVSTRRTGSYRTSSPWAEDLDSDWDIQTLLSSSDEVQTSESIVKGVEKEGHHGETAYRGGKPRISVWDVWSSKGLLHTSWSTSASPEIHSRHSTWGQSATGSAAGATPPVELACLGLSQQSCPKGSIQSPVTDLRIKASLVTLDTVLTHRTMEERPCWPREAKL